MADNYLVGTLRTWHVSNPPNKGHRRIVDTIHEAVLVLHTLAQHDLYLGDDMVSANAQGLEVWDGEGWTEWYDDDGEDIDFYIDAIFYPQDTMGDWFVSPQGQ